ncbi:DUF4912 domain-containing protein [Desulfothermobacter acidiphilus]|uniref:DUF4912 domain-containing protein n=1 Tax=Desulfothermobacter acidiphilus TaxID=1938353 RepID=UPI003F8CB424
MGRSRFSGESGEDNTLMVIPREPSVLFVYWDLSPCTQVLMAGKKWGLRLWCRRGVESNLLREVFPAFFCGDWYFNELEAGVGYRCELGWWEGDFFIPLLVSDWAATPPLPAPWQPPSPETRPEFEVPEERVAQLAKPVMGVSYFSWLTPS